MMSFLQESPISLVVILAVILAVTLAVLAGVLRRAAMRRKAAQAQDFPEAGSGGDSAVLFAGSEAAHLIPRNRTGADTPAEQFEMQLIRSIEEALGFKALSVAGTNASAWQVETNWSEEPAELVVVGPGYNTCTPIRDGELWLLRIRENAPARLTEWVREQFFSTAGVTRRMGDKLQTQFASSALRSADQLEDQSKA